MIGTCTVSGQILSRHGGCLSHGEWGIFRFQGCCSRAAVGLKLNQLGIKKSILDSDPRAGIRNRNFCHAVTGKSGMPHN